MFRPGSAPYCREMKYRQSDYPTSCRSMESRMTGRSEIEQHPRYCIKVVGRFCMLITKSEVTFSGQN